MARVQKWALKSITIYITIYWQRKPEIALVVMPHWQRNVCTINRSPLPGLYISVYCYKRHDRKSYCKICLARLARIDTNTERIGLRKETVQSGFWRKMTAKMTGWYPCNYPLLFPSCKCLLHFNVKFISVKIEQSNRHIIKGNIVPVFCLFFFEAVCW